LERIVRAASSEVRIVERARIVLAASEGLTTEQIAERVGCAERTVKKWRPRYERRGIEGLKHAPRSGPSLTHGPETRAL
jgi:transposase